MDSVINFIILGLATYRTSNMMADVYQGGPWDILNKIRHLLGVRYDATSNVYGETMIARGILCVFCNSVWIGAFFALLYILLPTISIMVALPLALSGLAIYLDTR